LPFAPGSFLTNLSLHSSQSSTYKFLHTDHSSIILVAGKEPIEAEHGPGQGWGRELTSEECLADPQ